MDKLYYLKQVLKKQKLPGIYNYSEPNLFQSIYNLYLKLQLQPSTDVIDDKIFNLFKSFQFNITDDTSIKFNFVEQNNILFDNSDKDSGNNITDGVTIHAYNCFDLYPEDRLYLNFIEFDGKIECFICLKLSNDKVAIYPTNEKFKFEPILFHPGTGLVNSNNKYIDESLKLYYPDVKFIRIIASADLNYNFNMFVEQNVVNDGVGDYHFNHYITYVEIPPNITFFKDTLSKKLTAIFKSRFSNIFMPNIGTVDVFNLKFNHKDILKFTIKIDGTPDFHDDYVYLTNNIDGTSFYGSTLGRLFEDVNDQVGGAVIETAIPIVFPQLGPLGGTLAKKIFKKVNKKHFLAGRRSWSFRVIEYKNKFLGCIDTFAFERVSDIAHLPTYNTVFKEEINKIWANLLLNFINSIFEEEFGERFVQTEICVEKLLLDTMMDIIEIDDQNKIFDLRFAYNILQKNSSGDVSIIDRASVPFTTNNLGEEIYNNGGSPFVAFTTESYTVKEIEHIRKNKSGGSAYLNEILKIHKNVIPFDIA